MKEINKIILVCFVLVLSGCTNYNTQIAMMSTMTHWIIYLAYILPIVAAGLYHYKVNNRKWFITLAIAFIMHILWVGSIFFNLEISFNELIELFY